MELIQSAKNDIETESTHWQVSQVKDVSDKITDGEHLTPIRSKSGFFLLSARNILNGKIDVKDVDYVELEEYNRIRKRCNPESGDVLISCSGTIGRVSIVPENFHCVLVRSAALIKPNDQELDGKYLQYILQSEFCQNQIKSSVNQGAQPNLFLNHIEKLEIKYPPLKEQKAIATALSDTDDLIAGLEKLIAKKKAIKQGAMQQLLTPPSKGGKRLPGFTGEWEEKKLGEISDIKTGSKNNQDKIDGGLYPFYVRSQTVERINSYSYDCEAILIPGEGGIGKIFHYIDGKFDVHQRVYKISNFSQDVSGKFIYYQLVQNFHDHAMKNSVKATVDSLRLPTFQEFGINLPTDENEQLKIVQILDDMEKEIEFLEAKKEKYEQIKQGMMQELLTGKTRLV